MAKKSKARLKAETEMLMDIMMRHIICEIEHNGDQFDGDFVEMIIDEFDQGELQLKYLRTLVAFAALSITAEMANKAISAMADEPAWFAECRAKHKGENVEYVGSNEYTVDGVLHQYLLPLTIK